MANLGNFTAAAVSARNENSLSLANLNFDFSLVKLQAPKEFQQLGNTLSSWRRKDAETGSTHRTARKLGALFEQLATPGEGLVMAYGQRVSQISASESINPKASSSKNGMFASQAGADGTAIWAAATSGKTAIAVVLLACMLARMWDPPKATSIWVELVEKRRQQISHLCDGSEASHFAPLAAVQQDISRKDLAEWDASARAWLSIADGVKASQHQRIESVLLTLSLPVDNSSDVFSGVVRAWTGAMATLESLIQGTPQRIHNGAVLLAISSWHLYPDLDLFGSTKESLVLQDSLIRSGGRLTVGLEETDPGSGGGVYWSLSLANLRFYGDPVLEMSYVKDDSKVTFDEILLVCLGCLLQNWESQHFDADCDREAGARFFVSLSHFLDKHLSAAGLESSSTVSKPRTWLEILADAARTLLEANDDKKSRAQGLVALGVRRGRNFLQSGATSVLRSEGSLQSVADGPHFSNPWADYYDSGFFDLSSSETLLRLFPDGEGKVAGLRRLAASLSQTSKFDFSNAVLRYLDTSTKSFEYATAFPIPERRKRDRDDVERPSSYHIRWISSDWCQAARAAAIDALGETCQYLPDLRAAVVDKYPGRVEFILPGALEEATTAASENIGTGSRVDPYDLSNGELQSKRSENRDGGVRYRVVFGNDAAAVLLPTQPTGMTRSASLGQFPDFSHTIPASAITDMLESDAIQYEKLSRHLVDQLGFSHHDLPLTAIPNHRLLNQLANSLQGLAAASQVYSLMPGAPVSLRVLEKPLWTASWLPTVGVQLPSTIHWAVFSRAWQLSLPQTLSCVAMFDTGKLDIPPEQLDGVFAMSAGNSIYAAAGLLADPHHVVEGHELRRIVGNVGRAGVSMLIPPANPIIRKVDLDNWQLINHARFVPSAGCGDFFDNTSLHLSFTGYEQPVAAALHHGAHDIEASYVETLVSVFDGSTKVADLDVLKALGSSQLVRMPPRTECEHGDDAPDSAVGWISIDSWVELRELPDRKTSIIRAHGNSLARLAASTVCIQLGAEKCIVATPDVCYACVLETWPGSGRLENGRRTVIC